MKVFLTATEATVRSAGIRQYLMNLLRGLAFRPDVDDLEVVSGNRVVRRSEIAGFITASEVTAKGTSGGINAALRRVPGAYELRDFVRSWKIRGELRRRSHAQYVYHEPNFVSLPYRGRNVITVYDLSHVRHAGFHPAERVEWLNRRYPAALARADRIAAISGFTRDELVDIYGVSRERIRVTHIGTGPEFRVRPASEVAEALAALGVHYRQFVLSVATLEPRKNLIRTIEAHRALPDRLRREFPLVLVGASGWKNAELERHIRDGEERREIIRCGYLSREMVIHLFSAAAVFAYVSLYEGFGIPMVEAFASGVPVLASNVSSLPEVSCGAALEVDPYSVDAIRDGMLRLLEDPALRADLVRRGLARASAFDLDHCAEQVMSMYREIA